ncbi:hypothetical protein ACFT7S_17400 [Streptomyces sp. NPDC057136]|uniref:hypothetical protein n=1 Tax=Streptomyces sp. NPDC057136 TaxID=3346029 RepID=UPI00363B84D3
MADAEGEGIAEGRRIPQHPCGAGRNQQWCFQAAGAGYLIKSNVNGAYCFGRQEGWAVREHCSSPGTSWEFDRKGDESRIKVPGAEQYLTTSSVRWAVPTAPERGSRSARTPPGAAAGT